MTKRLNLVRAACSLPHAKRLASQGFRPRGGVQAWCGVEAGGSHLQATTEEERIVDWTQDLREIRRRIEFSVRFGGREGQAGKAGERARRAGRRRTRSQPPGRYRGQDQSRVARGSSTKASDLTKSQQAKSSSSTPALSEVPKSSQSALTRGVQVVHDDARAQGSYRACKAWRHAAWKQDRDKGKASKVADQERRAAALTAGLAARSENKASAAIFWDAAAPQATGSLSLLVSSLLPVGQGFSSTPEGSVEDNHGHPGELKKQPLSSTKR